MGWLFDSFEKGGPFDNLHKLDFKFLSLIFT